MWLLPPAPNQPVSPLWIVTATAPRQATPQVLAWYQARGYTIPSRLAVEWSTADLNRLFFSRWRYVTGALHDGDPHSPAHPAHPDPATGSAPTGAQSASQPVSG